MKQIAMHHKFAHHKILLPLVEVPALSMTLFAYHDQ